MSGTLGNGAAPGCPARSRVGVAAEEQFLEDPVVSAPMRPASLVRAAKEQADLEELRRSASQEGRIAGTVEAVETGRRRLKWGDTTERVV
jgi:hypothetical protein